MGIAVQATIDKTARKTAILRAVKSNAYGVSSALIRERFPHLHERSRQRYLNELRDEGLITRLGSKNHYRWTVTEAGIQQLGR